MFYVIVRLTSLRLISRWCGYCGKFPLGLGTFVPDGQVALPGTLWEMWIKGDYSVYVRVDIAFLRSMEHGVCSGYLALSE